MKVAETVTARSHADDGSRSRALHVVLEQTIQCHVERLPAQVLANSDDWSFGKINFARGAVVVVAAVARREKFRKIHILNVSSDSSHRVKRRRALAHRGVAKPRGLERLAINHKMVVLSLRLLLELIAEPSDASTKLHKDGGLTCFRDKIKPLEVANE